MIPDYLKTHKEYTKNCFEINEYIETLSDKELDELCTKIKNM